MKKSKYYEKVEGYHYYFYKNDCENKIWCVGEYDENYYPVMGGGLYSFDKENIYCLWEHYPWSFTKEEKELFDKEHPQWAEFFKDRNEGLEND